jgi:hypothetical protein
VTTSHTYLPAQLLRFVQLNFVAWVERQQTSPAPVPMAPLVELLEQLRVHNCSQLPPLPPEFVRQPQFVVGVAPSPQPQTLARAPANNPTTSTVPVVDESASTRSRVNNLQYNAAMMDGLNRRLQCKQVYEKNAGNLPLRDDGKEMCLAWHLRGVCNTACRRSYDHTEHDQATNDRLRAWALQHWNASA